VLCSKATPRSYIEHLQIEGIPYVIAGESHVDLQAALKEVKEGYRVKRIVCQGGGAINGALLRAGLVNEISVLMTPFAVGGIDTPTLFDAPNLISAEYMTRLKLLTCKRFEKNFVWLHYQVIR
jgi:riboflavin biosynthesis pyrimidine reductase